MIGALVARYQPYWLERVRLGAPVCLGPTARLALAIEQQWRPERIFMQLIAKVDEANSHRQAAIMTMGGYIARVGQWNRFDHKWRKALRKSGLEYFHAVEMPRHPFGAKAVKIADDNLMAGFVVRLDRKDYEEVYRDGRWGGKAQPDSMYGLCFRFFLSACLEVGLSEHRQNLKLDFVVESGQAPIGNINYAVEAQL